MGNSCSKTEARCNGYANTSRETSLLSVRTVDKKEIKGPISKTISLIRRERPEEDIS